MIGCKNAVLQYLAHITWQTSLYTKGLFYYWLIETLWLLSRIDLVKVLLGDYPQELGTVCCKLFPGHMWKHPALQDMEVSHYEFCSKVSFVYYHQSIHTGDEISHVGLSCIVSEFSLEINKILTRTSHLHLACYFKCIKAK